MDPWQIEQLADDARAAMDRGDCLRAVAITDQLVTAAPENAVVRRLRSEALLRSGAGEEALDEARRAAQLDPRDHRAQTLLGLSAWRAGRLTLAQQALEQALELSGRKPGLLADYAWFMASERGPKPAERASNEAVAANPNSSTAWAALGLALLRLHRHEKAQQSLQRALELDPNDPYAQAVMARLLHQQRKDPAAIALTALLAETPGTESLVEEIRDEARSRQLERTLVERKAVREATHYESRWPRRLWLILAAAWLAGLIALGFALPNLVPVIGCGGLGLLVLIWILWRLLD